MATRTAIPGTKSGATDSLSVAEFNDGPGGLIGYATATSGQTSISSQTDLTSLTLTLTPASSRILRISFDLIVAHTSNDASAGVYVYIMKDGTQIHRKFFGAGRTAGYSVPAFGAVLDVGPTAASHTYKLQASSIGGAGGTGSVVAASDTPALLTIHDDGPSF